jgi:hypothetical protein
MKKRPAICGGVIENYGLYRFFCDTAHVISKWSGNMLLGSF